MKGWILSVLYSAHTLSFKILRQVKLVQRPYSIYFDGCFQLIWIWLDMYINTTPKPNMNRSTPGLPVHHQLPEFTKTHVHRVSDAIQTSYPLTSPSLPARNPSQHQGLFQWVNSSHEVAKLLTFQLYHQSFKWTPRPDPFRMDWLDLLAVQRTLKSLLQHHSAKASILWCPAFFTI